MALAENNCTQTTSQIFDSSYIEVSLSLLPLVCGDAGNATTCASLYRVAGPIWTCGPVQELGCCWSAVLEYVGTVFGASIQARIENGASDNQNNCNVNTNPCGIISASSALTRTIFTPFTILPMLCTLLMTILSLEARAHQKEECCCFSC